MSCLLPRSSYVQLEEKEHDEEERKAGRSQTDEPIKHDAKKQRGKRHVRHLHEPRGYKVCIRPVHATARPGPRGEKKKGRKGERKENKRIKLRFTSMKNLVLAKQDLLQGDLQASLFGRLAYLDRSR
jgi:hypothetical protein